MEAIAHERERESDPGRRVRAERNDHITIYLSRGISRRLAAAVFIARDRDRDREISVGNPLVSLRSIALGRARGRT